MGSRSIPTYCEHGKCIDPGDFGVDIERCDECETRIVGNYEDRIAELSSKLDETAKARDAAHALYVEEMRQRDIERELKVEAREELYTLELRCNDLQGRLDGAAKLCEVYWNIAVEAGVSEDEIRRKRDERFKQAVVERGTINARRPRPGSFVVHRSEGSQCRGPCQFSAFVVELAL